MAKWRIYYGDHSTYSDRDGSAFYAPSFNATVVVRPFNNVRGYALATAKDAFFWDDKNQWWNACDQAGLWDYLLMYKGPKAVIFGRSIRDKDYNDIVNRAADEGLG